MTRVVLFLTAVPLAAILALILDALLERASGARAPAKILVLLLGAGLTAFPGAALAAAAEHPDVESPGQAACATVDCSLEIEREKVEALWSGQRTGSVRLLYQSRIPVTEESLLGEGGTPAVEDRGRPRPRQVSPRRVSHDSLETLRHD